MKQLTVLVALSLAASACGGSATSNSTGSTLPVLDVTTTTTIPPTTTMATTTTTQPPAPVSGIIATSTGIAGWWDGSNWVSAEVAAPPLQLESEYQFVYLNDPITIQSAGQITFEDSGFCATPDSGLAFPPLAEFPQTSPIAVSADWDLRPHRIELLSTDNKNYEEETKKLLDGTEAKTNGAELVQVIRTDLEGDGIIEVIITAERISDRNLLGSKTGEFSIVFLRKVINDEVQTAILHEFVAVNEGGDFEGFMAPAYVTAIADLNGDGKMEIAMDSFYYEGSSTTIFEYVNNDLGPVAVLRTGCGA